MQIHQAAKTTKMIQDQFPGCKITIETTSPDPAKNIEVAKLFGKVGVRGKWRNLKEKG